MKQDCTPVLSCASLLSYPISLLSRCAKEHGHTLSAPALYLFDVGFEHSWLFFVRYFRAVEVGLTKYVFRG